MHECRQAFDRFNRPTGKFICKCHWVGTLEEAIWHCVSNQFKVSDK